jgi:uncharacterized protein (DUF169 family)
MRRIPKMENFRGYAEEIQKQLALQSPPIAVKMLEAEQDVPEGAKRPKRDFGVCLAQCQAFAFAERNGMSIAMLKEDMWCPEPVIGYGLEEPPEFFIQGRNRYPDDVETLEAGANWARAFPRFEAGKYVGIVSGPLATVDFEPDLVLIYCNTLELTRLLLSIAYKDGHDITSQLSGHSGCVYAIVPPMKTGGCSVSLPCMGMRQYAGCQDDKITFTVPRAKLETLVLGLQQPGTGGTPVKIWTRAEYTMGNSYAELARLMGMKKADGSEIVGKPFGERVPWE